MDNFKIHEEYLKGLHLDLSNTKVNNKAIPKLISSIENSENLISLGLDLGDLPELSENSISQIIEQIGKTES